MAVLLSYEHSLVSSNDLSKLNAAFFTMNGVISVLFFFFVAGDLLLPPVSRSQAELTPRILQYLNTRFT